jgi:HEAT repeat protein
VKKLGVLCLVVLLAGCARGKSTDEWIEQLQTGDGVGRLRAIKALSTRGKEVEVVVPALAKALTDKDPFVRRDAAMALGRIGPEARTALPFLQATRKDQNARVRRAASNALKQIDPAAAYTGGP